MGYPVSMWGGRVCVGSFTGKNVFLKKDDFFNSLIIKYDIKAFF